DTIQTHLPDTVKLETYYHEDYDYWWNGTSGTNIYDVQDAGWQYLMVTDAGGNGCSSYDSTNVELLFYDVGAAELVHPTDNCGFGKHEFPVVTVRNYGTDSITAGQKIAVTYVMNGGLPVSDTLVLEKTLYSGKTIDFTFDKGPLDLSLKGIYNFDVSTTYGGDTVVTNDAITRSIEILGRPVVTLGADLSVPALSHTLDAGTGYVSYEWDNGQTNRTRTVTESGTYWVQVFDENMCDNADTVNIWLKIRDIRPAGFASPLSDCSFSSAETVIMRVQNAGTDTVPSGTNIAVSYSLDGGATVNGTLTLSQALLPSSIATYTFAGTVNVNTAADYSFEAAATAAGDLRPENNDSTFMVYRYNRPVVDFGLDEMANIEDVSYVLDAGYSPHYAYQWQDTVTSHQYTVRASGLYHAKATDTRTQCFDRDTVYISLIYGDVGVTLADLPESGCSGTFENTTVRVQNLGTSVIGNSAPIYVACDVNGTRVTIDTLVRAAGFTFSPGVSLDLPLSGDINLGSGSSEVVFYTVYNDDKKPENDSLLIPFSALPSPVVDFGEDANGNLQTDLPHILDAGAGHKSYLWQDNATGQTYYVSAKGTYTVTVIGQNDCQTTKTVHINMQNSIGDAYTATGEVIVFPNPNQGQFSISLEEDSPDDVVVYLYNSLGQLVYMKECAADQLEQEKIEVQHLSRGIYQLLIRTDQKLYRGSVLIE
ncbi:MAG: T9SS type A sorting domain-containing protein, partial [Bacteroidales bacterium]|nr:T9SS type A sorting domain-containing protein [Bacteroidales bacterium]